MSLSKTLSSKVLKDVMKMKTYINDLYIGTMQVF